MRTERDSMGEMSVPDDALYGASTQRAVLNFPVSGRPLPEAFIRSLGLVKLACAQANAELGRLAPELARLIEQAAREVADGRWTAQFPVDVFQTGSATSTHTNANEVIANRCSQLAGQPIGSHRPVHPNDHVNLGQSSNDVIPTALHVSVAGALHGQLPQLYPLRLELDVDAPEDLYDFPELILGNYLYLFNQTRERKIRVVAVAKSPLAPYTLIVATERSAPECGSAAEPQRCTADETCGSLYTAHTCFFFLEPSFDAAADPVTRYVARWPEAPTLAGLVTDSFRFVDERTVEFRAAGGDGGYSVEEVWWLDLVTGAFALQSRVENTVETP